MKNVFLCLLVGFSAVSSLIAQDDDGNEPHKARGRVAWFVYTSMPEGLENPVSIMSGEDLIEVTLSKRSPSRPVKIPADGILRIVRKVDNPEDPGKPAYLTIAQAKVADGVKKALIVLMPVSKNSRGLLFQTKIQDLATFKGGDWLYLNMTNLEVSVVLAKTKLRIKPGAFGTYDAPPLSEPVNIPILYSYYHPVEKEWRMLSASTVVLRPTRREICIFSWDERFKRIDYHGITFPVVP